MTVSPIRSSGLLDLPVEARLKIYNLCFFSADPRDKVEWVLVDLHSGRHLVKQYVWPLFTICKQIYHEVMPEYYGTTEFHLNALVHLRAAVKHHVMFKNYARRIVLKPHHIFPEAEELLVLPSLYTLAIANVFCHEPFGTPSGRALDHETLKRALVDLEEASDNQHPINQTVSLRNGMANVTEFRNRNVYVLLRFRYTYIEKSKRPEEWGGKTAKRHRIIDYDFTNDTFRLHQPDAGEKFLITSSEG